MTPEDAREIIKSAHRSVDYTNFGGIVSKLSDGFDWFTFDNSLWRYNPEQALTDALWLKDHMDEIYQALNTIKENRVRKK